MSETEDVVPSESRAEVDLVPQPLGAVVHTAESSTDHLIMAVYTLARSARQSEVLYLSYFGSMFTTTDVDDNRLGMLSR